MGAEHGHGGAELADHRGRLGLVLAITLGVLVLEVIGAIITGSLALLADAGHMLTDIAGLTLGYVAAVLSRRPASDARTWGFRRAEVLGAAAQAAVLLAVGTFILIEAVRRLFDPPEVDSGLMLAFGAVGLLANLVGIGILSSARNANLNTRAAFLEVLNDTLGSVAVIVAAVVIGLTGWGQADAVASMLIGILIIPRTLGLLRETADVLMESTPKGVDLGEVRARILTVPHDRQP